MKDSQRNLLQAIGSIAGEIRELRKESQQQNDSLVAHLTFANRIEENISDFKNKMDIRFSAIHETSSLSMARHFAHQKVELRKLMREELTHKKEDITLLPISHLKLLLRSEGCLNHDGIITIKHLIGKTRRELLRITNFGKKSLCDVIQCLGKFGLKLKEDQ